MVLYVTDITSNSALVKWDAVLLFSSYDFRLYKNGTQVIFVNNITTKSYPLSSLSADTQYTFTLTSHLLGYQTVQTQKFHTPRADTTFIVRHDDRNTTIDWNGSGQYNITYLCYLDNIVHNNGNSDTYIVPEDTSAGDHSFYIKINTDPPSSTITFNYPLKIYNIGVVSDSVQITTNPVQGASKYTIEYGIIDNAGFVNQASVYTANFTTPIVNQVIPNLLSNTKYYIKIASYDASNTLLPYEATIYTTTRPQLVNTLQVLNNNTSSPLLQWSAPPGSYQVNVNGTILQAATNSISLNSLTAGNYTAQVNAAYGYPATNIVSFSVTAPPPTPPGSITLSVVDNNTPAPILNWTIPTGATPPITYNVYIDSVVFATITDTNTVTLNGLAVGTHGAMVSSPSIGSNSNGVNVVIPPVDCVGSFDTSQCDNSCLQTYHVTTPALNGGKACPYADGQQIACSTISCTGCNVAGATCPEEQVCNSDTGECEPRPVCHTDADCDDEMYCNQTTGDCENNPVSCTVADNCAETGQKCDESTGKCIDITVYCKEDTDCDGDLVCNTDTGQCIDKTQDCTTGIECGEGFICNADTGDCILVTHDCNEEGCPENQTCNISTGRCEKIKGTSYLWVLYITIPILILLIWFLIRELKK